MPEIDSEWTTSKNPDDAKTYKLAARDGEYLISIGGKYVKVKVTGDAAPHSDPIIVGPDRAPFRQAATRPSIRD